MKRKFLIACILLLSILLLACFYYLNSSHETLIKVANLITPAEWNNYTLTVSVENMSERDSIKFLENELCAIIIEKIESDDTVTVYNGNFSYNSIILAPKEEWIEEIEIGVLDDGNYRIITSSKTAKGESKTTTLFKIE